MSVINVANYFLLKEKNSNDEMITHLKLQKLVYYAQAWYLSEFDEPLFKSSIEAWIHGPVSPEVYNQFREKGNRYLYFEGNKEDLINSFTTEYREILDSVWNIYGSYDSRFLEELVVSEAPWKKAFYKGERTMINLDDMREYYKDRCL